MASIVDGISLEGYSEQTLPTSVLMLGQKRSGKKSMLIGILRLLGEKLNELK